MPTDWRSRKRRKANSFVSQFVPNHIWQEPGAPPQRPHIGAASLADDLLPPSAPTAKTLSALVVCFEPHSGHAGFTSDDIERTSWSNRFWHF